MLFSPLSRRPENTDNFVSPVYKKMMRELVTVNYVMYVASRSPVSILPKALLSLRQRHRYSCTDSVSTLTVDAQMSLQSFACPLLSSALHSSEQKHAH